jgi:hypothetical protein
MGLPLKFQTFSNGRKRHRNFVAPMKKALCTLLLLFTLLALAPAAGAQCSICTKTAQQLGEKPAKGLNTGILYLMATPLAIIGLLGFRWWRSRDEA